MGTAHGARNKYQVCADLKMYIFRSLPGKGDVYYHPEYCYLCWPASILSNICKPELRRIHRFCCIPTIDSTLSIPVSQLKHRFMKESLIRVNIETYFWKCVFLSIPHGISNEQHNQFDWSWVPKNGKKLNAKADTSSQELCLVHMRLKMSEMGSKIVVVQVEFRSK